jgi:hypothetical protein
MTFPQTRMPNASPLNDPASGQHHHLRFFEDPSRKRYLVPPLAPPARYAPIVVSRHPKQQHSCTHTRPSTPLRPPPLNASTPGRALNAFASVPKASPPQPFQRPQTCPQRALKRATNAPQTRPPTHPKRTPNASSNASPTRPQTRPQHVVKRAPNTSSNILPTRPQMRPQARPKHVPNALPTRPQARPKCVPNTLQTCPQTQPQARPNASPICSQTRSQRALKCAPTLLQTCPKRVLKTQPNAPSNSLPMRPKRASIMSSKTPPTPPRTIVEDKYLFFYVSFVSTELNLGHLGTTVHLRVNKNAPSSAHHLKFSISLCSCRMEAPGVAAWQRA